MKGRIPPGKEHESPFTTPEVGGESYGARWVWIGWMYFAYGAGIVTGAIIGFGLGVLLS